ncbi:hypothetical protein BH09ACT5_BH09ACT5_08350 [soil metagenome]
MTQRRPSPPLYRFLDVARTTDGLGSWPGMGDYTEVCGYSGLGHLFLTNPDGRFGVLHTLHGGVQHAGRFDSRLDFEAAVLCNPRFETYMLRRALQASLFALIGELGTEQVYIPSPLPFLGGDERPSSFEKGNVWIFVKLVDDYLQPRQSLMS